MSNNIKSNQIFNLLIPFSIFVVTIIIFGYFSTIGVDLHHDGIMFKPALDVASGSMLFRDTFTQYGALTTIIQAVSLSIFGKYLITIKFVTVFFYGLISILLYLVLKKILPKSLVLASLVIWIFLAPFYILTFIPWSSVYALFFQLLAVWLLSIAVEKKSHKIVLCVVISTSLVFWCRQPVGVFTILSLVAFLVYLFYLKGIDIVGLKKYLFYYIGGNILISAIFIVWLSANHAFIDWWKQSILLPLFWAIGQHTVLGVGSVSAGVGSEVMINSIRGIYICNSNGVIHYLARIFLYGWPMLLIFVLIRNFKKPIIVLLVLVSLVSGFQFYPAHDIRHCYWGGTLMLGLVALLIYQFVGYVLSHKLKIIKNKIEYLSVIIFVIIFLPAVSIYLKMGIKKMNTEYYFIDKPSILKNIRLTREEVKLYAKKYEKIEDYFKNNPRGNVIINGGNFLFLTFDNRIKNFHQMYVNWNYPMLYPDYSNKLKQYIITSNPLILTDNL